MFKRNMIIILIGLGVLLVVEIWWNWEPRGRNSDLENFKIPTIPGKYKTRYTEYSGLFSKLFFMVADLNSDIFMQYRTKVAVDAHKSCQIGKDALIVGSGIKMDDNFYRKHDGKHLEFDINSSPWWDVDGITSGTFHQKILPDSCEYEIIFDDKRHRIFIYWHYS